MRPMNPSGISDMLTVLKSFYKTFVGNLSFGNPTAFDSNNNGTVFSIDNMTGIIIRIGAIANPYSLSNHWTAANTALVVQHNLARKPIGFVVCGKDKTCDVYSISPFAASVTTITLLCTDGTADVLVYIF